MLKELKTIGGIMTTKLTNCPKCGKSLEYWTLGKTIACTGCREQIEVEPCEKEEETTEETEETDAEVIEVHM
jgi:DNA-directed RNA polymerase subunit RPC12/RpoP